MSSTAQRFTDYLDAGTLPFSSVELRNGAANGVTLAMVLQRPSPGVEYDPVDDLILSFPIDSSPDLITRDVGLGRQRFRITPNCILVTPPKVGSYWYFERGYQVLHISFPLALLQQVFNVQREDSTEIAARLAHKPLNDALATLMARRCWTAAGLDGELAKLFLDQALITLLATLLLENDPARAEPRKASDTKLAQWRLSRVMDLMLANLSQNLTTRDLAQSVGLSPYYFLRAFSATTGQTPHQWLSARRIERAKQMLRQTQTPITQIALDLGFSSPGHFSTRFRQMVGFSPMDWRRNFASGASVTNDAASIPSTSQRPSGTPPYRPEE
jgi:AraC-like DNA-binding protein